jgi:uncharacterized membrane protein YoaK (UPF0700 family)
VFWSGLFVLAGGAFIDSYVFLAHGHVFAQFMTGNLTFIGLGIVEPDVIEFWRPLSAVAAFAVGVAVGTRLSARWRGTPAKLAFVTLACLVGALCVVGSLPDTVPHPLIVVVLALPSGMQIATFRRLGPVSFMSAAMTGDIVRTVENLLHAVQEPSRDTRLVARIDVSGLVFFVLGAFIGALMTRWIGTTASWGAAAIFGGAAVLRLAADRRTEALTRSQSNDSYDAASQLVQ